MSERPNIILILADDMGYSDIGCYGSEIETPNLDQLAQDGARFTQFYNFARCMPTRASLLTGLYPHQAGIGQMAGPSDYGPAYQGYLNRHCLTIAEALRLSDYRTLMVGKWHVGFKFEEDPGRLPRQRGFERFWGIATGAANYFEPSINTKKGTPNALMDDDERIQAEGYFTDMISDHAASYIDQYADDGPFFLYVAYTAPHWPLHALPEDIAKYEGKYAAGWDQIRGQRFERMKQLGILSPKCRLTPRDEKSTAWENVEHQEWEASRMAVYAAQVDNMDQGIGRIVAKLKEKGVFENTLIMFLSDNGGCAERMPDNKPSVVPGTKDTWASYGLSWANVSNTPFRLYKHWVHEGGIATPFIAHWPEAIKPGMLIHHPAHIVDVMATCLDVTGTAYPQEHHGHSVLPPEGHSLRPLFAGEQVQEYPLFWEHEGNRAVRLGRWKLTARFAAGSPHAAREVDPEHVNEQWELYDMEADRSETTDLASRYPDKVEEMSALYDAWAQRIGVKPWRKSTDKDRISAE